MQLLIIVLLFIRCTLSRISTVSHDWNGTLYTDTSRPCTRMGAQKHFTPRSDVQLIGSYDYVVTGCPFYNNRNISNNSTIVVRSLIELRRNEVHPTQNELFRTAIIGSLNTINVTSVTVSEVATFRVHPLCGEDDFTLLTGTLFTADARIVQTGDPCSLPPAAYTYAVREETSEVVFGAPENLIEFSSKHVHLAGGYHSKLAGEMEIHSNKTVTVNVLSGTITARVLDQLQTSDRPKVNLQLLQAMQHALEEAQCFASVTATTDGLLPSNDPTAEWKQQWCRTQHLGTIDVDGETWCNVNVCGPAMSVPQPPIPPPSAPSHSISPPADSTTTAVIIASCCAFIIFVVVLVITCKKYKCVCNCVPRYSLLPAAGDDVKDS